MGATAMGAARLSVVGLALVAACAEINETSTFEQAVAQTGPAVVINEFTPGSSGKIELYNAGDAVADLSGWQVDDIANGGYAPKSVGTAVSVAPGAYLVISYAGVNTASVDDVRLVDATGAQRDIH